MKPKSRIVHLPVYQPGKPMEEVKRELGLDKVTKLASNENPFGCSPKAREAIMAELDATHIYPDGGAVALTTALSERLGVQPNQIIFGAGSDEVILMLTRAYLLPGDETVMASHTFPQYKHNAEVEGATVIEVPLKDGKHDLEAMLAACTDKTKIVWICNPNNPTGTIVTHKEVEQFLNSCSPDTMVVLDEAYVEYIDTPEFPDGLALLKQYPNVVLLRTFSKIYGLASLRIGYGIGHPDVIHAVNQVREPFNTTRYGQVAALASLADDSFVAECRERNVEGIKLIQDRLDALGLSYFPAYGNFIMIHTGRPAQAVFDALLRQGFIVRGGHSLGYPESIRVTIGSREENEAFLTALEEVLKTVSV